MQRELKVGLSLGVLILGVVGALLFRRETVSDTKQPTLKTARKLDERIAENPRTPYMTGDVEFDLDDELDAKSGIGLAEDASRPAHSVAPNWLNDDDEDPFKVSRKVMASEDQNANPRLTDTVVPVKPRKPMAPRATDMPAAALQTHVIQSGDSLSSLAARYLGSQGKFQELYAANRDVLTDPNRLPLGATIVIPSESKAEKPGAATIVKTLDNPRDQARGTITDVSTIDPINPTNEANSTPSKDLANAAGEVVKSDESAAAIPVVPTKPNSTKRFFAPARIPFANNTRRESANPLQKPLDPEGEDFSTTKPTGIDPAQHTTGSIRRYVVVKGDSLEKISQKIYGNSKRAADIYAANKAQLLRPDSVREGQELIVPE